MANTLKKGAAQLKELAGTAAPAQDNAPPEARKGGKAEPKSTVLIGAHFPRAVRRSLAQLQADPRNDGKKLQDLIAEALNDLFDKYGVPRTAHLERED